MTAEYKIIGDVAVITMSNLPVNGLGLSTRVGITDGLTKANADAAVKSIIITGAGKAFSGGADIKEFGSSKAVSFHDRKACEDFYGQRKSLYSATSEGFRRYEIPGESAR